MSSVKSDYHEFTIKTLKQCSQNTPPCENTVLCNLGSGISHNLVLLSGMLQSSKSVGIEACPVRHMIAKEVIKQTNSREVVSVNLDILKMSSLPFGSTHIYIWDHHFKADVLDHVKKLIIQNQQVRYIVTTQKTLLEDVSGWSLSTCVSGRIRGTAKKCKLFIFGCQ